MENPFFDIIKPLRIEKGITQKQLCNGICSISKLSFIESGKRAPSYTLRTRLLKRLGISTEKIVNILEPDEYLLFLLRNQLISFMREEKYDDVKYVLKQFCDAIAKDDTVSKQFACDIRGMLAINDGDYYLAADEYQKAIDLTMNKITINNLSEYAIAPIEYYYILMALICRQKINNSDSFETNSDFFKILNSIEESKMDIGIKSEIYPLIVVYYARFLQEYPKFYSSAIGSVVNRAISMLRSSSKMFFLLDLLEIRDKFLENSTDEEEKNKNKKWINALEKIHTEAGLSYKKLQFFYLYEDENCRSISYVIKERRKVFGLTQSELAENNCSIKTLRRIEQGMVAAQYENLKMLYSRLGLSCNFQYEEIITDNWNAIQLAKQFRKALNENDINRQEELFNKLDNILDHSIPQNEQTLIRNRAFISKEKKSISSEEYIKELERALSKTVPLDRIKNYEGGYLTEEEMRCIYSIAIELEDSDNDRVKELRMLFEKILCNETIFSASFKSLILRWLDSSYGNSKEYRLSNYYVLLVIQAELQSHRMSMSYIALYDKIWNDTQAGQLPINPKYIDTLEICYYLADLFNDNLGKAFFKSRIDLIKVKDQT